MPDRAVENFLAGTRWSGAERTSLAGDASLRRYERLGPVGGETAVLMIAPPGTDEALEPFLRIGRYLAGSGFSAPVVLKEDPDAGLLLLEDLGDALFARLAETDPAMEEPLYAAAVDFLAELHRAPVPDRLTRMTPKSLAAATDLAGIWYSGAGHGAADPIVAELLEDAFSHVDGLASVLVLRDFHAENLICLPQRHGTARVGLLDFQDALIGHPAYDLVSLLQDARRDLAPGLAPAMMQRYLDLTGLAEGQFRTAATLLAVQRNLRILGVFARLSLAGGKAGYLRLLPRVWAHLTDALAQPGLEELRAHLLATLPPPDDEQIKRLAPR